MNLCWTIFYIVLFLNECQARIFMQKAQSNAILPHKINLRSTRERLYESLLFSSTSRTKRDADSGSDKSDGPLEWTMKVLGNATNHNQALIHWSGDNSTIVFILTRKKSASPSGGVTESTLWRSSNYGNSYTMESDKFGENAVLKSYYVCPTDKMKVIFVDSANNSGRIWVSENEGATYTPHNVSFSVDKIEFHPSMSSWVLGYDKSDGSLWASKNLGTTWTKMQDHVTVDRYYWYVKGVDSGPRSQEVVHMEYRDMDAFPSQIYLVKSCLIPDCATPSEFQTHTSSLGNIAKDSLVVQDDYIVAQKPGSSAKLYVSYLRNDFRKAQFTIYEPQTDFHLISTDNDCIVIGVNHNDNRTRLFFSDKEGYSFRISMIEYVRYFERKVGDNKVYTVDIHEVAGLYGVYIANVAKEKTKVVTKITHDYGKTWNFIQDLNEKDKPKCMPSQDCNLHLHLAMDQTQAQYYMPSCVTKKTVPGLIVAHGVYGERLQDHPVNVNIYVSEDGGLSWHQALKQRHLIVIADHGSILVCIRMIFLQPVSQLHFSNDAGKTWTNYTFSNQKINVDGILTEPGEHTFYLTLFGHQTYRDSWRVYQINMKSLFGDKQCQYPGDFVNKTFDQGCEIGMKQQVEALKPGQLCLVGMNYKRKMTLERCKCSDDDYECDVGFHESNGKCAKNRSGMIDTIPSDFLNKEDTMAPCVNGQRTVPTGWRKSSGNNCTGDLQEKFFKNESCIPHVSLTEIHLVMHNVTNRAAIGESLYFSVQGTSHNIKWEISKTNDQSSVTVKQNSDDVHVKPSSPGMYKVRAMASDTTLSDTVIVEFWYPIKRVNVYVPPVVATNRLYNATATVETVFDIRGDKTQVGIVKYSWLTDGNMVTSENNKLTNLRYDTVGSVHIKVTADNDVSYQTAREQITVKSYVQEIVFSFTIEPPLNNTLINSKWLNEFEKIFSYHVFELEKVEKLLQDGKLAKKEHIHMFIGPELPLQASIFVAPSSDNEREKDLLAAAADIQKYIMTDMKQFPIAGHDVTMEGSFLINGEGEFIPYQDGGVSGVVVALAVILVIVIIVALLFIFRKYITALRVGSYFRNMRNVSVPGMSHIVRNQNNDLSPIVGNEFIDDDLDTMETIGSDQGTLEFHG